MGDISPFFQLPPLVLFTLMAVVLVGVNGRARGRSQQLWTIAFVLIALEGFARILYSLRLPKTVHLVSHAVALDAYVVAGAVFLLSAAAASGRAPKRYLTYIAGNVAPALLLSTLYAMDVRSVSALEIIIGLALICGPALGWMQRDRLAMTLIPVALWLPVLLTALWLRDPRQIIYTALALLYALNGLVFLRGLRSTLAGRFIVVLGFLLWAGCFLFHAPVAQRHASWTPMLDDIWDIQKFMIMFGLLVVSLSEQRQRAEHDALHDALTGLANRRLFEENLTQALSRAAREKTHVLLFNMDLDGFKSVNDTLGHGAGDDLLRAVATRLRQATRRSDTLARIGGDEFQLIAGGFAGSDASDEVAERESLRQSGEMIAAKLQHAVRHPVMLDNGNATAHPSMSIGFSIFPFDGTTAEDMSSSADVAMYKEKRDRRQDPEPVGTESLA